MSGLERELTLQEFGKWSLVHKEELSELFLEFEPVRKADRPRTVRDGGAITTTAVRSFPLG